MEVIKVQNREFKTRELDLPEFGNVLISTESLNKLLVDEKGNYFSDEMIHIDEKIFFFVDENEIDFEENELIEIILSSII